MRYLPYMQYLRYAPSAGSVLRPCRRVAGSVFLSTARTRLLAGLFALAQGACQWRHPAWGVACQGVGRAVAWSLKRNKLPKELVVCALPLGGSQGGSPWGAAVAVQGAGLQSARKRA